MLLIRRVVCCSNRSFGADKLKQQYYSTTTSTGGGSDQHPQHFLQFISDVTSGDQRRVDYDVLSKKILLLYFSAGWCTQCKEFTPKLKTLYQQAKYDVTVLWISRDKSKEEQLQYYEKSLDPSWLYVPLGKTVRNFLKMYPLHGLPSVKMVDSDGNLVEEELKSVIEKESNPDRLVQQWKKQLNI